MGQIQIIELIEIENVRGIGSRQTFNVQILPNKPTLLVAPNGFGKSSIATAFASLTSRRLDLHRDAYHKGDETLVPSLAVRYVLDDKSTPIAEADGAKNDIFKTFDVFVINSRLISKARKSRIAGTTVASASLEVEPIVLVNAIPSRAAIKYSVGNARATFGANSKVLPNIADVLRDHHIVAKLEDVDFGKHLNAGHTATIKAFCDDLNRATGNAESILKAADVTAISSVPYLNDVVALLKRGGLSFDSEASYFLAAVQIAGLYIRDKAAFKKAVKYAQYQTLKESYEREFGFLKSTWKNIAPKEIDGQLLIEFPKANQISNGERDAISFIALLLSARERFARKPGILIIDELFDYLDDANVVACQYHITRMIEEIKGNGSQIFPVIMTHLNPMYFRNHYFSGKKLKVRFLNGSGSTTPTKIEKIIFKRTDPSIEDNFAKHFLHYNPSACDLTTEFTTLRLPPELGKSEKFVTKVDDELNKYLQGQPYDPIAVCCAVRRTVEKIVYDRLSTADQSAFLKAKTTVEKLDVASEAGVDVPEVYYLLGIVYNSGMHVRENSDNAAPVRSQLEHLMIKQMIETVVTGKGSP